MAIHRIGADDLDDRRDHVFKIHAAELSLFVYRRLFASNVLQWLLPFTDHGTKSWGNVYPLPRTAVYSRITG